MRLATIVGLAFALFVVNVVAGWPMTLATAALFAVVAIGMRRSMPAKSPATNRSARSSRNMSEAA